ncbi:unnamed protein product [marine sediment metagenome]|uniref:Uncharacterized protein n=1 Tax=marine sediment metagenome TaxID=412755 RepID=X0XZZ1_9ZZZZ
MTLDDTYLDEEFWTVVTFEDGTQSTCGHCHSNMIDAEECATAIRKRVGKRYGVPGARKLIYDAHSMSGRDVPEEAW